MQRGSANQKICPQLYDQVSLTYKPTSQTDNFRSELYLGKTNIANYIRCPNVPQPLSPMGICFNFSREGQKWFPGADLWYYYSLMLRRPGPGHKLLPQYKQWKHAKAIKTQLRVVIINQLYILFVILLSLKQHNIRTQGEIILE